MGDQKSTQWKRQLNQAIKTLQDLNSQYDSAVAQKGDKETQLEDLKKEFISLNKSVMQQAKTELEEQVNQTLTEFSLQYDQIVEKLNQTTQQETYKQVPTVNARPFAQKVFVKRSSLLNKLLKNKDFKTLYHIFFAFMIVMSLGEMMKRYMEEGKLLDLSLVIWAFGKLEVTMTCWLGVFLSSFLVIPLVQAINQNKLKRHVWVTLYSVFQSLLYLVPCTVTIKNSLPIASAMIVTCEMTRISMKVHSYLREKLLFGIPDNEHAHYIPDSLKQKGVTFKHLNPPQITIEDPFTEVKRFLFFMFAPTLIYRDNYPRISATRRWNKIFINTLNCFGTIFYVYIIFQTFCIPFFEDSWRNNWSLRFVLTSLEKSMVPGTMLLILAFVGVLHTWQNLWAEIMRFGDRKFYEDWWNVTSFAAYYRKWNIVVHEWLYNYVYQDFIRFTKGRISQLVAFFFVFLISAFIHEVIIAVSMGFFYPILLIMFGGPGVLYAFLPNKELRSLNIFVWSMFFIGNGFLIMFYSWEYFARNSLDLRPSYSWMAPIIPHSWIDFQHL